MRTDLKAAATRQPGFPNPEQFRQNPNKRKEPGPQTEIGPKAQETKATITVTAVVRICSVFQAGTWILRPESISVPRNSLFVGLPLLQVRQSPKLKKQEQSDRIPVIPRGAHTNTHTPPRAEALLFN